MAGEAWIIDVPLSVEAYRHPDARGFLEWDVTHISRYFQRLGLPDDTAGRVRDLWDRYSHARL